MKSRWWRWDKRRLLNLGYTVKRIAGVEIQSPADLATCRAGSILSNLIAATALTPESYNDINYKGGNGGRQHPEFDIRS